MSEQDPLAKEARRQNRITEKWLLDIELFRAEYLATMDELTQASGGGVPKIPSGKGYLATDRTCKAAMRLCDTHSHFIGWVGLVRDIEVMLPYHKRLLLILRREARTNKARREGWCPHLQAQYDAEVAKARGGKYKRHSKFYFSRTWKEVVNTAARVALKRGLFNEEEERG